MADGERFDVGKFIRGFNIFSGPVLGKIMHQAIIFLILAAIAIGIWYKMFGQRTIGEQTHQTAQQITNIEEKDKGFRVFGIELFGWRR